MNTLYANRRSTQVFDPAKVKLTFGVGTAKPGTTHVNLGKVRNVTESWEDFKDRLRVAATSPETFAEFMKLPKEGPGGQDALKASAGFVTGAPCKDGSRRYSNLLPRTLVSFDLDTATPETVRRLDENDHALKEYVWFAHTTRKHTAEKPRLRVYVLLKEPVPTDQYEPLARTIASLLDRGLQWTDKVSFRSTQLMFLPTVCSDGAFVWFEGPGTKLIDWRRLFERMKAKGRDLSDVRNWPRCPGEEVVRQKATKAEDPWEKPGLIGAFCRVYPIEDLIEEHFSDLYAPGDASSTDVRYSWLHGGTSNGLVIYEDGRFATSHHSSDPLADQSVNAWDFARLVKFGEGEDSNAAMMAWASALPKVQDEMAEVDAARADAAFGGEEEPHEGELLAPEEADPMAGLDADDLAILGPASSRTGKVTDSLFEGAAVIAPEATGLSVARKRADAAVPGSDTWAGEKHAARVRGHRLYESVAGKWLRWTGQRWAAMTDEETAADAKETSALLFAETSARAADDPSPSNRTELGRVGKLHGSRQALTRMVESARSESGLHVHGPAEFDRNPMTLTVTNGILNLTTGCLRPAAPSDRVSRLAGCAYDPDARSPLWDAFLERILPDPEVRAFLQRFAGYGLTGSVDEEVFILLHGSGANGKSVFCEVYDALLAEMRGAFGAVLVTKSKHENEAARLVNRLPGLRAAFVNETSIGDVFDSQRVKELSSRDKIAARPLYGEAYDFAPTHKLWIRTNHLPGSLDAGDGFWRRCIPIGFGVQIPEGERDKGLARRIIATELPGVLNWALAGCLEWQKTGLRVPATIDAERRSYREETDLLGQWLEGCIERQPDARLGAGAAFGSFAEFCREQGASAGTQMSFSRALTARGFRRDPSRANGRRFLGLSLRMPDRTNDFEE